MYNKNDMGNMLLMTVTEGVTVNVLPSEQHEYLMTTSEVANGYGVSGYAVIKAFNRHLDELIEGKHFVKGRTICPTLLPKALRSAPHANFWTKRGIVRLGFFISSERAKFFRDWAEELIIKMDELAQQGALFPVATKQLPKRRNHNRLTSERLIRLLQLTHRIEHAELRNEIVEQLMGGNA